MYYKLFLALGSNLGDREKNINAAIELLREKIAIDKISPLYETAPVYCAAANTANSANNNEIAAPQGNYLNGALRGQTDLSAPDLLAFCLNIEKKIGRVRPAPRWSARVIDIDILFYNDEIINTTNLQIPHPRLHERRFVLQPLNDLAPAWRHPQLQKTVAELYCNIMVNDKL